MSLSINSDTPVKMPVSPLQILLLIQLEGGPKYGYEMLKTLKEEFEGTWEPKTGTVYPALRSLEKKGYVSTFDKDGTDYYRITEEGKELFQHLEAHFMDSVSFTVKYLSVLFKWMSLEMKTGAMNLLKKLTEKENALSSQMLKDFTSNFHRDVKRSFLNQMRQRMMNRLQNIDRIMEETQ